MQLELFKNVNSYFVNDEIKEILEHDKNLIEVYGHFERVLKTLYKKDKQKLDNFLNCNAKVKVRICALFVQDFLNGNFDKLLNK